MKKSNYNLEESFACQIMELFKVEKEYLKYFEKLSGSASTKELHSALSAERSGQDNHVSRLEIVIDALDVELTAENDTVNTAILKQIKKIAADKKKPALSKDIQIIRVLKIIYGLKIASYSSLQLIAENLELEQPALLLGQTMEDSRNNMAYLIQIERNVIYPQIRS